MAQIVNFPFVAILNDGQDAAFQVVRRNAGDTGYEWGTAAWVDRTNTFAAQQTFSTGTANDAPAIFQRTGGTATQRVEVSYGGSGRIDCKSGTLTIAASSLGDITLSANGGSVIAQSPVIPQQGINGWDGKAVGFALPGETTNNVTLFCPTAGVLVVNDANGTRDPAVGLQAKSSTTNNRDRFRLATTAVDNTDATRKYRATLSVYDTAAREAIRMEASGSAPMLGFLGAAAVARPTVTGTVGDADAMESLLSALHDLGLITNSTV